MKKLYPIGTVVLLKKAKKRVMITGFFASDLKTPDKTYDYMGCPFPEGILSSEQNLLFDEDQIEDIYHYGLDDGEEFNFKTKLKKYIDEKNDN